jgi:ABC-type dipeptide/oligopeptide/nickel transport system ATPase component
MTSTAPNPPHMPPSLFTMPAASTSTDSVWSSASVRQSEQDESSLGQFKASVPAERLRRLCKTVSPKSASSGGADDFGADDGVRGIPERMNTRARGVYMHSAKIEDTLEVMDMVSVKDVVVGGLDMTNSIHLRGLSSGQQRRLQVATQLMQSPSVVILDEPTTGLDTTNALHVIQVGAERRAARN